MDNGIVKLQSDCESTYKRKSCSQYGSFPLTVTVVDFTFCNFNVTYVLNCADETSFVERE